MLPLIYFVAVGVAVFLILRLVGGVRVMGDGRNLLPVIPLGWALSLFLALTFVVCVVFDLILPEYAMYQAWAALLPGFTWLTPGTFLLGLAESFLYGWYGALIFGGLFNVFAGRGQVA